MGNNLALCSKKAECVQELAVVSFVSLVLAAWWSCYDRSQVTEFRGSSCLTVKSAGLETEPVLCIGSRRVLRGKEGAVATSDCAVLGETQRLTGNNVPGEPKAGGCHRWTLSFGF